MRRKYLKVIFAAQCCILYDVSVYLSVHTFTCLIIHKCINMLFIYFYEQTGYILNIYSSFLN